MKITIEDTRTTGKKKIEYEKLWEKDSIPEGEKQFGYVESPEEETKTVDILTLEDVRCDDVDALVAAILERVTLNDSRKEKP